MFAAAGVVLGICVLVSSFIALMAVAAAGVYELAESPLRRAPHTVAAVVNSGWDRKYTVEQAAFPVASLKVDKYFPAVGRIDGAGGDRNLICSCPAPEAFED